jgi:hypothetical protein
VPKPCIGIVSIGEMGLGIAKLLRAHDFPVVTIASGRRHVLLSSQLIPIQLVLAQAAVLTLL